MSANGHTPSPGELDRHIRMALDRAQFTQAELERHRSAESLLDEIARTQEDAVGALMYAASQLLPAAPGLEELFVRHAGGLLAIAAKFEAAAELAASKRPEGRARDGQHAVSDRARSVEQR